jgi:15-cis-phytoene synthase
MTLATESGDRAVELCLATLAHHAKSFHFASHVLPARCRADAAVLYAWCRFADDAIDLAPPAEQHGNLSRLVRDLDSVYAGEPQTDPVLGAFQQIVRVHRIPREYPAELLAGMAMDLDKDRYASLDELLHYAFRVAGTVGLMMAHVLGVSEPAALRQATHLGMAMQLTNICRDVAEDWERGRLYLPLDWLAEAGAPGLDGHLGGTLPAAARRPVIKVVKRLLAQAETYYQSGDRGLTALSPRCALGVRTARLVYAEIGAQLALHGYDPLAGRAFVPLSRKLALLAQAVAQALRDQAAQPGAGFHVARIDTVWRYPDDIIPL